MVKPLRDRADVATRGRVLARIGGVAGAHDSAGDNFHDFLAKNVGLKSAHDGTLAASMGAHDPLA